MANHFYVDESRAHKGPYLLIATKIETSSSALIRKELKTFLNKGQKRIHFTNESDGRRKQILAVISNLEISCSIYSCSNKKDIEARYRCINALFQDTGPSGISRVVMEARESQDHRDLKWFKESRRFESHHIVLAHSLPRTEPLLWIPDAIGWAYGRGNPWREMVSSGIEKVIEV